MLGRLTWAAIPFDQPIVMVTVGVVGIVAFAILGLVTVQGWWPYLWREWITSVDHKCIGVMYFLLGTVMLVRGFADAIMMRTQLALAAGGAQGYLPPEHYGQIFSAHGTIMIFFVAMPFVIGLMNFAVPLQLGVCGTWRSPYSTMSASGSRLRACCSSTFRCSSASSPAPAG
jgi:cytochrome o ubiquinol oxidase subunit 1